MLGELTYRVEVEDEKQLTELRQVGHLALDDVDGARVAASSSAAVESEFTVIGGIRGKPAESWSSVVRAQDEEAAKAAAIEEDERRTVNGVLPGAVEVAQ